MQERQGEPQEPELSRNPLDAPARKAWRLHRMWNGPQRLDPTGVPESRPQSVVVVAFVFILQMLLFAPFLLTPFLSGSLPWPVIAAVCVVSAFMVLLTVGLWNGREVARWWLMRIGIGMGAIFGLAAFMNLSFAAQGLMTATALFGGVLTLLIGLLMLAGGLATLLPSVREWCGGRYF